MFITDRTHFLFAAQLTSVKAMKKTLQLTTKIMFILQEKSSSISAMLLGKNYKNVLQFAKVMCGILPAFILQHIAQTRSTETAQVTPLRRTLASSP